MLKLYNTLTKKIEVIEKKDHLNLYTCGPTVYNYAHIGNLRSYILADLLYRVLKFEGYNPRWVMNITDIDDKTRKGTILDVRKNKGVEAVADVDDLKIFTQKYYDAFLKDLREVNVSVDEIEFIRVTDKMKEIKEFVVELLNKGYAYKMEDGSTYFSIEKYQKDFGDYGQLVGGKFLEGKKIGARVKADEYEKDNVSDFALWKVPKSEGRDANILWDHPILGKGRPGWHIECSVINHVAFNGEPTDIHTGGVDLIFPHHTNEIAQSQALFGKGNFVHHWFHSEHLLMDGKKMAKKLNNFYTLKDLGNHGNSLRFLFLQAHYRTQQNFTSESLRAAHEGSPSPSPSPEQEELEKNLDKAIIDIVNKDLSIPEALGLIRKVDSDSQILENLFGLKFLESYDEIPSEISSLAQERQKVRDRKDFKKSDELRKQIEAMGYEVMDTPEGQKIRKKLNF